MIAFVALRLLAAVAAGLALGWLAGWPWVGLAAALAVVAGWHWHELYRLRHWLRNRRTEDPPDTFGAWSEVGAAIVRLHRRKRFHKARMLGMLRELRESTAALPDAVVVMNASREILWCNDPATQLLGLRRARDIGVRLDNLLRQPELQEFLGKPLDDRSFVVRITGDVPRWLMLRLLPFGEGRQLLLARDVTATQQLAAVRRDFVANASHELRTPLTVIAGYLEALEGDGELPASMQGPLTEMRRQSDRMRALLDDLLSLSKLDATGATVEGGVVDVPALLRRLLADALAMTPRPARIELRLDSDRGLKGDEGMLQSAFWNLIENAVKYTPTSGAMELSWRLDAEGAHFAVSDNGPGIAEEHIPRLTERFYRVDPSRDRSTGGTGLGLAIVKHALEKHDAHLGIRSEPGTGSVFTCHFPLTRVVSLVR